MPMIPFIGLFPEVGSRETRVLQVADAQDLPAGEYAFLESYCDQPGCDCRRTIIQVLRSDTGAKVFATIGYGWESEEFYRNWLGGIDAVVEERGPYLDPLNAQSAYAEVLLGLFEAVLESPDYVDRLKRHYRMFRDLIDARHVQEANRMANRRKRLRNPKRRRRHL